MHHRLFLLDWYHYPFFFHMHTHIHVYINHHIVIDLHTYMLFSIVFLYNLHDMIRDTFIWEYCIAYVSVLILLLIVSEVFKYFSSFSSRYFLCFLFYSCFLCMFSLYTYTFFCFWHFWSHFFDILFLVSPVYMASMIFFFVSEHIIVVSYFIHNTGSRHINFMSTCSQKMSNQDGCCCQCRAIRP